MDNYQKNVYKKFPTHSWLSNKANYERIVDWITFYRRNIPVFVEHYLNIPLHWYQIIWLYLLNIYTPSASPAFRAAVSARSSQLKRIFLVGFLLVSWILTSQPV